MMTNPVKFHFDFWGIFGDNGAELVKAIANKDLACVQHYAKKVKLDEFYFGPGWTCLHYAAMLGRTQSMAVLLDNHADIDITTQHDETPLFMAVRHKHYDAVKQLLEHGANASILAHHTEINSKTYYQLSPLELAKILKLPKMEMLIKEHLKKAEESIFKGAWGVTQKSFLSPKAHPNNEMVEEYDYHKSHRNVKTM